MIYPIFIGKKTEGAYRVTVPDLPGCFASGNTVMKAVQNARLAVMSHLEELFLDDGLVPFQKSVETHLENPVFKDMTLAFVEVNTSQIFNRTHERELS